MTCRPTVVLADDHPPTREGLRVVLEEDGWDVLDAVGTASAAVASALRHRPDICLLDVNMPGGGVDACDRIARALKDTAVVMLTVSAEADDLLAALRAGARGYLMKDMNPARLGHSLRGVLDGEAALPRSLTAMLMEEFRGREGRSRVRSMRRRGAQLTEKEWTVLEHLRDGLSTAEAADAMGVAPVTVRSHVSAILRKLDVTTREEAVAVLDEET